jgi:hypothetical protein
MTGARLSWSVTHQVSMNQATTYAHLIPLPQETNEVNLYGINIVVLCTEMEGNG